MSKIVINFTRNSFEKMLPKDFNQQAQKHWNAGQQAEAIECVVQALNEHESPKKPKGLFMQFTYYLFLIGDYSAASQVLVEASKHYPDDTEIKLNLAVSLSRNKEYEHAIKIANELAEQDSSSVVAWDVLANCYAKTQQFELAVNAGDHALRIKDQQFSTSIDNWELPKQSIDSFISNKKYVIAFSLWGNQERYINGAIRNASLRKEIYPDWEIWVYIDDSVPESVCDMLTQQGVILKKQASQQSMRDKLCWRFKVANHPDVGRFLIRDIDSVFSKRERLAVEQWIQSDKWFHTIHDWWSHTDLILAGLWGGIANVLPDVWKMVEAYQPDALTTPNIDQWFLRDCVWSYLKQSCLMHDRLYRKNTNPSSLPIPGPKPTGNQHIGSCEFSQMPEQQRKLIAPYLENGKQQ